MNKSEIIVLTDGECRFCEASIRWVSQELEVKAIAYASGPLGRFGYHWVATHRNSILIKALTFILERAAR